MGASRWSAASSFNPEGGPVVAMAAGHALGHQRAAADLRPGEIVAERSLMLDAAAFARLLARVQHRFLLRTTLE